MFQMRNPDSSMSLFISMGPRRSFNGIFIGSIIVLSFYYLILPKASRNSLYHGPESSTVLTKSSSRHLEVHQHRNKVGNSFGDGVPIINDDSVERNFAPSKRDDDRHFFDRYKCKGDQALNMIMHNPPSTRIFTRQDQVDAWEVIDDEAAQVSSDLTRALQALGIPHSPNDIKTVASFQTQQVTSSGGQIHVSPTSVVFDPVTKVLEEIFFQTGVSKAPVTNGQLLKPPTNGEYVNYFIVSGQKSTIIGKGNFSPAGKVAAGELPPDQPFPALNRWSDVVWQNWTGLAGTQARQLRYVMHENIDTLDTRKVIEYIEVAGPDSLNLPYPGTVYDMRSDDGKALLGTAHGMGVAWLVIDHSNVPGRKIPAVRVFTAPSQDDPNNRKFNWWYYLIFELRNSIEGPD